jgi:hypothetical protein
MSLPKWSLFKWRSCIWEEDLSLSVSGIEPWRSTRDWRFGLAERIENVWDRVGKGNGSLTASERVVRDVIRDLNQSHDEMVYP